MPGFKTTVFVCVSALMLLITSGAIRCDIWTLYDWVNKFYCFYLVPVVIIGSGKLK